MIEDSTVLITGGTGSFGHRVARSLLARNPAEVRVFSRDEKKQWEMARAIPGLRFIVGDVRDRRRVAEVMRGVDFVFHAAALKQVPSCEAAPVEAIKTNVQGSINVCEAAIAAGVRSVVALSTDKAVKPINAMGMSKALMEKVVVSQNAYPCSTIFSCVRYGNVMGSRGSVIPLFVDQVRRDLPITVTAGHMTRFLLTLDDSVDLVYRAMTSAVGGEVFVRRAPSSTVAALAKAVRTWLGEAGHPIKTIGIRPGEKIHEVLVNEYEMQRTTSDEMYFTIWPEYREAPDETRAPVGSEYTSENAERLSDTASIIALLERMGKIEGYV